MHDAPVHIRQSEITTLEPVREAFVVDAELVQQRCVEIMHVHLIHFCSVAQFIGLAIRSTARTP